MYPANMFKNVKPIKLHVVMFVFGIIATWFFAEALSLSNQNTNTLLMKKVLLSEPTKNVVYSPFSANVILALLAEAGDPRSTTTNDLILLLPDDFPHKIKNLIRDIRYDERHQVTLGTKILSRHPTSIAQQYFPVMRSYNASVENLNDFPAERINRWAKRITKGNLNQLVNDNDIDGARLVMINILFFQAKWLTPFTESFNGKFSVASDNLVEVSYMWQKNDLNCSFDENLEIVQLAYEGSKYSMMILLPKMGGLEALIDKIDENQISQWQRKLEHDKIELIMPKFNFSSKTDLRKVLTAAGKQSIFAGNFNKLGSEVRISEMIQKAGISVDERGTTAFAATAALDNRFGGRMITCFVNRPFLFLILDTPTNEIMFAGKVINPNLSD